MKNETVGIGEGGWNDEERLEWKVDGMLLFRITLCRIRAGVKEIRRGRAVRVEVERDERGDDATGCNARMELRRKVLKGMSS